MDKRNEESFSTTSEYADINYIQHREQEKHFQIAELRLLELLEQSYDKPFFPERENDHSLRILDGSKELSLNLELFKKKGLKSILIQSILPGEGSSTILFHLAKLLVQKGPERVLSIDCNIHNPELHQFFHLKNEVGLMELLNRKAGIERVIRQTPYTNLYCLPAGQTQLSLEEINNSTDFENILQILEFEFDHILIDCAALKQSDLGFFLAQKVNGVILVIHSNRMRFKFAQKIKRNLLERNVNVLGVIVNRKKSSIPKWLERNFLTKSLL